VQGAATLAGVGCQGGHGGAMALGLLLHGDQLHLWKIEASDKALMLSPGLLKHVKDSTELRVDDAAFEPQAYCEALWKASLVSLDAFANSTHMDVTYVDLFNSPWRYRGEVIHFEGKLRRIRRFDPPGMIAAKGIKDLYECWFFDPNHGPNPSCLVCSELPAGVVPGERLELKGRFDAYFFKKYRYTAIDSKPGYAREAPLFLGRSFVVTSVPPSPTVDPVAAEWKTVLLMFLGFVLATFILAFGLHWWLRHGDRRVHARIKELRPEFTDPGATGLSGTTPSPD